MVSPVSLRWRHDLEPELQKRLVQEGGVVSMGVGFAGTTSSDVEEGFSCVVTVAPSVAWIKGTASSKVSMGVGSSEDAGGMGVSSATSEGIVFLGIEGSSEGRGGTLNMEELGVALAFSTFFGIEVGGSNSVVVGGSNSVVEVLGGRFIKALP